MSKYFFEKIPRIFSFVTLLLEILQKIKLHPWKFHNILLNSNAIQKPRSMEIPLGIFSGIEEIAYENSRVQLKKKWNFHGCSRKNRVEFPWILVFDLRISKGCHTSFQNFQRWKFFSTGKVTNVKISRGFWEKYSISSPPLPCPSLPSHIWFFSGITQSPNITLHTSSDWWLRQQTAWLAK